MKSSPDDDNLVAQSILDTWLKHGNKIEPGTIPEHPEFVYRKTGDWKSWNDFLGIKQTDETYQENILVDAIEELAWTMYLKLGKNIH